MIDVAQLRRNIKKLNAADEASKREAIHSFKEQPEQEWAEVPADLVRSVVESLQGQLVNGLKQTFLRQEILITLGNIGPRSESVIPQLIDLLKDGVSDGIREEAATALGKIGKKAKVAVDHLIEMLPGCRTSLAVRVILALGGIGGADQKVKSALVDLWQAPDQSQNSQVQVALALCKSKIDAKGLLVFLTRTLAGNQDSALRKSACDALSWCNKNDLDVVPALLAAALHDKDEKVRIKAEDSLTHLKLTREKAIQICAVQLKESVYAEAALRNSGQLAVPALTETLASDDTVVKEKTARILGCLGELALAAVPALTKTLRDKDPIIRLAAAKAMWNVSKNADAIVPVLVDLLDEKKASPSEEKEERRRFLQTVIEALWRIGPAAKAAVPALNHKAKDHNRLISESAQTALKAIVPPVPVKAAAR